MEPEFVHSPSYMTCSLTCYSDPSRQDLDGLPVARVHYDPQAYKFKTSISSCDLSTYYLPDLLELLNTNEEGYKTIVKRHKKITGDMNLIDYDELRQILESVDSLNKMSKRLHVVGVSVFRMFHDTKKLNTAVCIGGLVAHPDQLYIPAANFMDNKYFSVETVADVLVNGVRPPPVVQDLKTRRYSLSGSVLYLLIYKRSETFDFLLFLSEDPISELVKAVHGLSEFSANFDFIYTVLGRTKTEEESRPYNQTSEGVYLKNVILYSNETNFTQPVLKSLNTLSKILDERNSFDNPLQLEIDKDLEYRPLTYPRSEVKQIRPISDDDDDCGFGLFD